jgi:hypothetical protein
VLVGQRDGTIKPTPLTEVAGQAKELDLSLFEMAGILAM